MPRLKKLSPIPKGASSPVLNYCFLAYPKIRLTSYQVCEGIINDNKEVDIACVSPLHTQPDEEDGTIKPHFHCLVRLKRCQRVSYGNKRIEHNLGLRLPLEELKHFESVKLGRILGLTKVQPVSNFGSYYCYLTHENDQHKEIFSNSRPVVMGSSTVSDLDRLYLSNTQKSENLMRSIAQIEEDIVLDGYKSYLDFLLRYPVIHHLEKNSASWFHWRSVAQSRSNHIRNLIADSLTMDKSAIEELRFICETNRKNKDS